MTEFLYYFLPLSGAFAGTVWWMEQNNKKVIMKINEAIAKIEAVTIQVGKVRKEIQALKDALTNIELPEAAVAALANLEAAVQSADDENPDATEA